MSITPVEKFNKDLQDAYIEEISNRNANPSPLFVPLLSKKKKFTSKDIKLIAFYLPQFHTFPLNDAWYGKGFTEWTNVTKAIPQFTGHYQPRLPIDTGFYDLNDIKVMQRQVELATLYGIHAFCFHYYWFSGERLMEMPIFNWLKHPEIDFPFCLNWANENWGKLWDGGTKEVFYKQELKEGDDEKFFNDILPFFKDNRYIKIDGKPLLTIYRPHLFTIERTNKFTKIMREKARENGFPDLYILGVNSAFFSGDPREWGLDGLLEFPPHGMGANGIQEKEISTYINPLFKGGIRDGKDYIEKRRYLVPKPDYKLFKGVCPSWDNTARKAYSGAAVIDGISPALYQEWLENCITYTREAHIQNERFIFINAWNEWAEAAHLEPCIRYGYAYLQATHQALINKEIK